MRVRVVSDFSDLLRLQPSQQGRLDWPYHLYPILPQSLVAADTPIRTYILPPTVVQVLLCVCSCLPDYPSKGALAKSGCQP